MTTVVPTRPLTTSGFLFGRGQDIGQALAHALKEKRVLGSLGAALGQLSQAGREAADGEVATVIQGLLDLDLGDLAIAGWRRHAVLTGAAERTIANPGSSEVVDLATHRITSIHKPSVELLINEVHVATVRFELRVEFLLKALVAIVRHGHLVALRSGTCDVTATLAAEGVQLAKQQAHLSVPMLIPLPLHVHRPDGDPPLYGARRPSVPSPSVPHRTPTGHAMGKPRRQLARRGPPAE